jgi:hypothetical protein
MVVLGASSYLTATATQCSGCGTNALVGIKEELEQRRPFMP